ncbi:hypothetical protein ACFWCB_05555 [Streptomyces sp. NPDC060048]
MRQFGYETCQVARMKSAVSARSYSLTRTSTGTVLPFTAADRSSGCQSAR